MIHIVRKIKLWKSNTKGNWYRQTDRTDEKDERCGSMAAYNLEQVLCIHQNNRRMAREKGNSQLLLENKNMSALTTFVCPRSPLFHDSRWRLKILDTIVKVTIFTPKSVLKWAGVIPIEEKQSKEQLENIINTTMKHVIDCIDRVEKDDLISKTNENEIESIEENVIGSIEENVIQSIDEKVLESIDCDKISETFPLTSKTVKFFPVQK